MAQLFTNNAVSELYAPITSGASSIQIVPGDETLFPTISIGSGDYFMVTIEVGSTREIVKVTSTSGSTFGVVRGQEGTSATSWSASATVAHRLTAAQLSALFPVNLASNVTGILPVTKGGTNRSSYTIGDLLLATASNVLGILGIGATNTIIMSNGTTPTYTGNPIITTLTALTALIVGLTTASTGAVRLPNASQINARNAANSADEILIEIDSNDQKFIGGASDQVGLRNETTLAAENATGTALIDLLKLDLNDIFRILATPVLNNGIVLSSRDNADTVTIPLLQVDSNDDIIIGNLLNQNIGFGRTAPEARHHFGGSVGFPIRTVQANATFGDDFLIIGETASGNIALNLPPASNTVGRLYAAKHVGATNTITLTPNASDTIEGVASIALTANNEVRIFISDGVSNWALLVGA